MNEITRQIDGLNHERNGYLRDMRGINPKLSLYKKLAGKAEVLHQQIEALRIKRGDRSPYKASYGVETMKGSAVLPSKAI